MKNPFVAFFFLLSSLQSNAQLPDTTAFKTEISALRERRVEVINHIKMAEASIKDLKKEYKNKSHDSAFTARMMYHSKERRHWKDEYKLWNKTDNDFDIKREDFNRSMLSHYKTQPFIKYQKRSRLNQFLGVTMVSAGGLTFLGGLINGMTESPSQLPTTTADRETHNRKIMAICILTGSGLVLASIPFFRAAHANGIKFKSQIIGSVDIVPLVLPNGYQTNIVGFKTNIPLFSQ